MVPHLSRTRSDGMRARMSAATLALRMLFSFPEPPFFSSTLVRHVGGGGGLRRASDARPLFVAPFLPKGILHDKHFVSCALYDLSHAAVAVHSLSSHPTTETAR